MSLSAAETPSNMQVIENEGEKQKKDEGDDQSEVAEVAVALESVELKDPAILEVRGPTEPRIRYTPEELLKLRDVPLSQVKPEFLNAAHYISIGGWSYDRKRSETPAENGPRGLDYQDHKRRSGDPRERIRKEQDRIVLSPQRESFNHGCCVPGREISRNTRSHSPIGKTEANHIAHPPGSRRIGSGRIIREPWDYQEKSEVDFGFRRGGNAGNATQEERFERRSFGFEMTRDKGRNARFNDRRRISENREEEPEWFSGGPVSQTDTIELRGFDDGDKAAKKKQTPAQKKRAIERAMKKSQPEATSEDGNSSKEPAGRSTPSTTSQGAKPTADKKAGGDTKSDDGKQGEPTGEQTSSVNLDYFFGDSIPGLLTNGVGGDGDSAASESRFKQWFTKESPDKKSAEASRRSSFQEDSVIKNLLKDITETSVTIPNDSSLYFTPISPAANTGGAVGSHLGRQVGSKASNNLMEMLQRGSKQQGMDVKDLPGKLVHLEEVEACIRQRGESSAALGVSSQKIPPSKSEEDMAAFKRLLAQMTAGQGNGTIPQKTQPMSIMEMLSHSQQQDEARLASAHLLNSASPNAMQQQHDLALKLQQQQRQIDMLSKIFNARPQVRASPLPDLGLLQSRELLNRPEAQAILQGLQRGDITFQHLQQQLAANPAMQPRHRELLFTILSTQGGGGVGPSPRGLSPVPPPPPAAHPMFQQQQPQQQLRVSPIQPNAAYCVSPILATSPNTLSVPAMHQRIPSPCELRVHTQNILQRALIKKKLEEQQENFRKKQEMQQRGQSPASCVSPAKSVSSPTPLTFTPTSVLRKMTAEKEEGSKEGNKTGEAHSKAPQGRPVTGVRPQAQQSHPQQWNTQQYPPKQPAGRAIVKANANYQPNPVQTQPDFYQQQQQRMFNQAQQLMKHPGAPPNANQYSHPHQYNPPNQFPQLTQQQLRAQHQQHLRAASHQQQQQNPSSNLYGPQQQQQNQQPTWQQLLNSQQNYDERSSQVGRGGVGGDLSPTSNQLARWFSPNLLEKARAGKLPNMPTAGLSQHTISLEEIERQTAAPVHN